jgi:signal transduction histidine kinase
MKDARSAPVAAFDWEAQTARLERQLAAYRALQDITHRLTSELHRDQLLSQILQNAVQVVHANAGSLLLLDPGTDELVFRVVLGGAGDALLGRHIPKSQGIAGWVFNHRQAAIAPEVARDPRFSPAIDKAHEHTTHSLVAAPLVYQSQAIGVIEALNKKNGETFDDIDKEILAAFAAQSAIAIQNAQLFEQVVEERDRLLVMEEQVRREIARDLHDGASQSVAAIIMGLQFLKEVMERRTELAREEIADLERIANQALQQLRNLQFNLRPLVLESQGLAAALEFYAERQRAAHPVAIALDVRSLTARFSPRAEAAIFGIVQEAITNAIKHASAKNVWLTAQQEREKVTLRVRDDGIGFDVSRVEQEYAQRGSLGLLTMKERAQIAGAKFSIASSPPEGTLVTIVIPIRSDSSTA